MIFFFDELVLYRFLARQRQWRTSSLLLVQGSIAGALATSIKPTSNGCHKPLDPLGRHRACNAHVVSRRGHHEAGTGEFNVFSRDMNLGVGDDETVLQGRPVGS